jgi:ankyrin repeat protein/beta-lactamase regulating signal transducer with metallopeptidase domain/6-phosphogluconolactonase (cycloisomerase 2 family)
MESWLSRITDYLLAQSWQIAVLTVVVAIVSFLLRNRSAHVRYLLWLLVLAKCLVPPLHSVPLAVLPQEQPTVFVESSPIAGRTFDESRIERDIVTEPAKSTPVRAPKELPAKTTNRPSTYNIRAWLAIGWLVGAMALLFYNLLNALRTQIWLQRQRKALPVKFRHNIEKFFSKHRVKQVLKVWLINGINQPFVWGLVRGSIYLPADLLNFQDSKSLASLLGHELSHVIRLDAMVHTLQIFAQVVFWFHPFVWWANRKIRAEREKCCDEMAIVSLHALPEDYSEAIVEVLAAKYESIRPVPSLAVAGPVKNIEERIKTMLRPGKKFYKRPSLIAATVVLLMAVLTVPTTLVLTAQAATEEREDELGKLEYIDHLSSDEYLARSTSVAISPDGRHLYTTAYGSRCLVVFSRDEVTGYIKRIKTIPLKGAFTTRVSSDGRYVVCSDVRGRMEYYAGSNSVSLFERDQSNGNLTQLDSVKNGENGIESLDYVVDAGFSPDSRFVYVVARRSAAVTAFRITDHKKLSFVQADKGKDQCFDGARGIAVSPDGKYVYVASVDAGTLAVLQRDAETGKTSLKQVFKDEQGDVHGLCGVWDVTYSPDGRFIYTNAGRQRGEKHDDAVCTFERMPDGTLSLVQELRTNEGQIGVGGGSRLRISPDGKYLYALGMDSDSILSFQRHPKTGKLTYLQTHSFQRISRRYCLPADLEISPDGAYVYVVGEGIGLNGIVILKRLPWTKKGTAEELYEAACSGDRKRLQSLIKNAVGINTRGQGGYTALHWAAKENQKNGAELLLEVGADVNARTSEGGWNPLHIAALQSNKDVAESLIAKGAELDAENHNNRLTSLLITQRTGDIDFAEFLLGKGANLNNKDEWGWTPLHKAAAQGDTAFADLLIKKGADVNVKDDVGHTPLFIAIRWYDMQMIEWLISKGANVNAKDRRGETLLAFAKRMNYTPIVELLRKHGAK